MQSPRSGGINKSENISGCPTSSNFGVSNMFKGTRGSGETDDSQESYESQGSAKGYYSSQVSNSPQGYYGSQESCGSEDSHDSEAASETYASPSAQSSYGAIQSSYGSRPTRDTDDDSSDEDGYEYSSAHSFEDPSFRRSYSPTTGQGGTEQYNSYEVSPSFRGVENEEVASGFHVTDRSFNLSPDSTKEASSPSSRTHDIDDEEDPDYESSEMTSYANSNTKDPYLRATEYTDQSFTSPESKPPVTTFPGSSSTATSPELTTPSSTYSEATYSKASGDTVSGSTASGTTDSGDTLSGSTVSGPIVPGSTVSGSTVLGSTGTPTQFEGTGPNTQAEEAKMVAYTTSAVDDLTESLAKAPKGGLELKMMTSDQMPKQFLSPMVFKSPPLTKFDVAPAVSPLGSSQEPFRPGPQPGPPGSPPGDNIQLGGIQIHFLLLCYFLFPIRNV